MRGRGIHPDLDAASLQRRERRPRPASLRRGRDGPRAASRVGRGQRPAAARNRARLAARIEQARRFREQPVAIAAEPARLFERRKSARQIRHNGAHAGPFARIGIDQRSVEVEQHETDHRFPAKTIAALP